MYLSAISPIDGRYKNKTSALSAYFSESALIKYRVFVEVEYFIALCNLPLPELEYIDPSVFAKLKNAYKLFSNTDAQTVKEIEQTTNHDVKAVEYFVKSKFDLLQISQYKEFVHFGLTSQDINNTAIPLSIKHAMGVYYQDLNVLVNTLKMLSEKWKDITLLARTHGQPASPTRLGKEIDVFVSRLDAQIKSLKTVPFSAKFGGSTGNFNAHQVSYPRIDWNAFGKTFVEETLGLHRSFPTTQIEHYDHLAALFDNLKRINTILIDLNRDIWTYISMDYFKQKINPKEIGSSAMPHKINPIDFENSEGNLGIANALFAHMSEKLPISRLQRDLTDSTVLRNIGVPFGHTLIAIKSCIKGLEKLLVNKTKIDSDLEQNWVVVAEAIQSILRRENYPNPYESLKELTRNNEIIDKKRLTDFIDQLAVSEEIKKQLKTITPYNYTGI